MHLSEIATPYFSTIEIIEFHHNNKIDAPSGTALATAEKISQNMTEDLRDPTTDLALRVQEEPKHKETFLSIVSEWKECLLTKVILELQGKH